MDGGKPHSRNSEQIRKDIGHPVIDGDGHILELGPVVLDYMKQVGGQSLVEQYLKVVSRRGGSHYTWYNRSGEERAQVRTGRPAFWIAPTRNTLDRATAMLPNLMRKRMDEFGIDFSILYTTEGLPLAGVADPDVRSAAMRAYNIMYADLFRSHRDRLCPAALIPMHTPEAAIKELDFAIGELGLKAAMIEGTIKRPVPAAVANVKDPKGPLAYFIDPLAMDSPYDYDPVWQKFVDLKVAPTDHRSGQGWVSRSSISNYTYNHIGGFGEAGHAFCKALFMGGVTRRFPQLNFGFLECGVGWACNLYSDIVGHWEKRNIDAANKNLNPDKIDRQLFIKLLEEYGDDHARSKAEELRERDGAYLDGFPEKQSDVDEWAACKITQKQDIHDLFVPRFFFGCEADDPMTAWAFSKKVNPMGAQLKAIFSSDIGHWDVTEQNEILVEAYELVEDGLLTEEDFKDFVFRNPVALHTAVNPDFFKGTAVESALT